MSVMLAGFTRVLLSFRQLGVHLNRSWFSENEPTAIMHATIMHTLLEAMLASVVCLVAWILYCVAIVARRRIIIKRQFPGPPTTSFLFGTPCYPFRPPADLQKFALYISSWRAGSRCLSITSLARC